MTWKAFLESSLYMKVLRRIIYGLWHLSVVNDVGKFLKCKYEIKWAWLPEVYQVAVVTTMLWALWNHPNGTLLTSLAYFALYRSGEILIFLLNWILETKPVVDIYRSLVGFVINQTEIVLCFAVVFRKYGCGMDTAKSALYNSLRTAVTIGPTNATEGCESLVGAEIVVAYLLTVLVIAAVVGNVGQRVTQLPSPPESSGTGHQPPAEE